MRSSSRIQVHDVDGITVIRFNDQQLFDERTVREAADQIAISLAGNGTPIKLIIDFSDVSLISSSVLSKLISIQRMVEATRGHMRLCELSPILQQVFRTSNLDRLFKIDREPADFHRSPHVAITDPWLERFTVELQTGRCLIPFSPGNPGNPLAGRGVGPKAG